MANHEIMMDNRGQMESMANIVKSVENTTIHESNPKPIRNSLKSRFAAGAAAFAIVTGAGSLSGCDQIQKTTFTTVEPSETVTPTETTVKVTPTPTEAPTEAPTATPTPEVKINAPNIEGYTNEVDTKTGLINLVNNETKEVDYIYNPNVWVGDKQVGGIAGKADKIEKIKVSGDIIPPFNLEEITDDTNFTIESCKNIAVTELTGNESNIVVMEFDTPLTLVNSCIENNKFNTVDGFTAKMSFEKEDGEIIKIDSPVGLVPFSCFEAGVTGVNNEYYISDVVDQNKILNFDQDKAYVIGEPTDVIVKSVMSVWRDYDELKDTNITDVAVTKEGNVIFSYPQEAVVTKTNN